MFKELCNDLTGPIQALGLQHAIAQRLVDEFRNKLSWNVATNQKDNQNGVPTAANRPPLVAEIRAFLTAELQNAQALHAAASAVPAAAAPGPAAAGGALLIPGTCVVYRDGVRTDRPLTALSLYLRCVWNQSAVLNHACDLDLPTHLVRAWLIMYTRNRTDLLL